MQHGIRILVVDSHRLFSSGLVEMLRHITTIRWADSLVLEEIIHYPRDRTPDLILFSPSTHWTRDLLMQETRRLRFFFPQARLVYLLDRLRRLHFRIAVELQLDGCWTKHWHFVQLCRAIQCVMQGQRIFNMEANFEPPSDVRKSVTHPYQPPISRVELLTPREFQIFQLLASGFSVRECAEYLGLSKSTVDNHKINLMRKLQIHKAVQLAWLAANDQWLSKPVTPHEIAIQADQEDHRPADDV